MLESTAQTIQACKMSSYQKQILPGCAKFDWLQFTMCW